MRSIITGVAAVFGVLSILAFLTACRNGEDNSQYILAFGEVAHTVNQSGYDLADSFLLLSSCVTDEQCAEATDGLVRELERYIPVIETQIQKLEQLEPLDDWQGLQSTYLEQLRLRVDGGKMIIDGWESADEALVAQGFERFQESQAKLGEILDELKVALEDQ